MVFWGEFLKEAAKEFGVALALGLALAVLLWLIYRFSTDRSIGRIGKIACHFCGQPLGREAVSEARRIYEELKNKEREEIQREASHDVLVDFDELWEVHCPQCGQVTTIDSIAEEVVSSDPTMELP